MKSNYLKRVLTLVLTGTLMMGTLTGCGGAEKPAETKETETEEATAAEDEDKASGEAEEEKTKTAEEGKKELLVVSFGTSYNESRELTIGGIEGALTEAYPDYEVKRAFTSQIIIDKLLERDGLTIMNVSEALEDAVANGVDTLVVQPTHLMDGFEYTDLAEELSEYEGKFARLALAKPLLIDDADYTEVARALINRTMEYNDGETAICFMGHGTEADSNQAYGKLQQTLRDLGSEVIYIGTVEAEPSFQDVIDTVKATQENGTCVYKRAVLIPLMVVAGDHANNDMAGDEEDSWKSMFEAEGFAVDCVLEGLGQNEEIRQIYVRHTREAIDGLE